MYLPVHFQERRVEVLHGLIRTHPFAALIALTAEGLEANHIPFEIDSVPAPFGTLRGHVARANGIWRHGATDSDVLVIFQGPDAYVTPSWYATKSEAGKVVPTWNYAVVHAHGPLRVIEDPSWLRRLVIRLTERHESGRPDPWNVSDAPEDFVEKQLRAIVGLEIPIRRLVGKWKVSQNRVGADRRGVVQGLRRDGSPAAVAMAQLVERAKPE
jgi:transcriptional regulator